jgi:hypothetical protein
MASLSSYYPQPVIAGTTAGTYAEGNDSRIEGAATKAWPAGVTKTVYLSARTDGVAGSGTLADPYDASTQQKFDEVKGNRTKCPDGSLIYLLAGNYESFGSGRGFGSTDAGLTQWPDNCHIRGAGIGKTVITLVGPIVDGNMVMPYSSVNTNTTPSSFWPTSIGAMELLGSSGGQISVVGLTIDCNFQNFTDASKFARKNTGITTSSVDEVLIKNVEIKNSGGSITYGRESFQFLINGSKLLVVEECIASSPQVSAPLTASNTRFSYVSGITVGGYGLTEGGGSTIQKPSDYSNYPICIIRNNHIDWPEPSADLYSVAGGGLGIGLCKLGIVEGNSVKNANYYIDTGWAKNLHIRDNFFYFGDGWASHPDPTGVAMIPININFLETSVVGIDDVWIYKNHIEQPYHKTSLFSMMFYLSRANNVKIFENSFIVRGGDGANTSNVAMRLQHSCNNIDIYDNIVDWKITNIDTTFYTDTSTYAYKNTNLHMKNNRDQNGIKRFDLEYAMGVTECNADFSDPLINGFQLRRAFQWLKSSSPNGIRSVTFPRPLLNKPILLLGEGIYDVTTSLDTSVYGAYFTSSIGSGNCGIVGTGSADATIIKSSNNFQTLPIASDGDGYFFENITIENNATSTSTCIGIPNTTTKATRLTNVILKSNNSSAGIASLLRGTFLGCKFIGFCPSNLFYGEEVEIDKCVFESLASSAISVSGGTFYNCRFNGGTGRMITFADASKAFNCLFVCGDGGSVGLSNGSFIEKGVIENGYLFISGADNRIYNTTINAPEAETFGISASSGASSQLYNVGTNKPVDTDLTISSITQFNNTGILSGTGAPSATAPNGSIFLRTDGDASSTVYVRAGDQWRPLGAYEP